jgi:hypothetical protein
MAIGTYAELNTAAANWSGRSDLTSRIPEFIALAEAKMNRRLRVKDMVTKNATYSITGEYVAVPTDFGGVKYFALNDADRTLLTFMPDLQMTTQYGPDVGKPTKYNVQGTNFRFAKIPDATYASTLVYYLKVPALTGSATTNWMLTAHPDAYLYGVMSELCGHVQDWAGADKWVSAMYAVIDEIKQASGRDSYAGDAAVAARPG